MSNGMESGDEADERLYGLIEAMAADEEPAVAVEGGDESAPMPAAPVAATPITFG